MVPHASSEVRNQGSLKHLSQNLPWSLRCSCPGPVPLHAHLFLVPNREIPRGRAGFGDDECRRALRDGKFAGGNGVDCCAPAMLHWLAELYQANVSRAQGSAAKLVWHGGILESRWYWVSFCKLTHYYHIEICQMLWDKSPCRSSGYQTNNQSFPPPRLVDEIDRDIL